jgi:hypothetical protein
MKSSGPGRETWPPRFSPCRSEIAWSAGGEETGVGF